MDKVPEEKTRNVFCFFFFGVLSIFFHEVMQAATKDVLAGSHITALTAVLTTGVPQVLVKALIPWIIQKIPHVCKLLIIFLLFACGLVMLVVSPDTSVRLAGMSVAEVAGAVAEMTFLSQTAFYSHTTTSAFAAGIGVGSVIGALYYTATTTWFCVVPRIALAAILPGIVLFPVVYTALDRSPLRDPWMEPPSRNGIKYELVATVNETFESKLSWSRRWVFGWLIFPLIIFLYWASFTAFLSNDSVVTTMAFWTAPFRARDHNNYYTMCHHLGTVIGLSYLLVVSYTCPNQLKRVQINKPWILAVNCVVFNILLVTMSWYRYVHNVGVIMVLCFFSGFANGAIYVNSSHMVREKTADNNTREFGLSLLTLGVSAGLLAGGLLGLYTEPALRERCLYALKLGGLCLTEFRKGGWLGKTCGKF